MTTSFFLVIIALFLLTFSPPFSSSLHPPNPNISRGLKLFEEKTRLGSRPPSCHNKCNGCHPCMAVQVPSLPSHDRARPGFSSTVTDPTQYGGDPSGNRYSNYKPLGWKCRCGDHFYNP